MTAYPLRQLDASLHKYVRVETTEIENDPAEGESVQGKFVFRYGGEKHLWSDKNFHYEMHTVETVAEAQGIMFECPLCYTNNGGPVGTHAVLVSFADRNVPEGYGSRGTGGDTRWAVSGTSLDDLMLTPSILLNGPGCGWHGFVGSSGIPPGHAG